MRICFVSDTHEHHSVDQSKFWVPTCDLLVHAGDFTGLGEMKYAQEFNDWLRELKMCGRIKYAIVIPGNHEKNADPMLATEERVKEFFGLLAEAEVLNNSETTYGGYLFYGSPQTPRFHNWAFNVDRGAAIREYWDRIPDETEILITHGPPSMIGDQSRPMHGSQHLGCVDLREAVKRVRPLIHVFGHIHGGYGITHDQEIPGTIFMNASICNEAYKPVNSPIVIDLQ